MLPEVVRPWKGRDVCLMNQNVIMAVLTVINIINSAGVWQDGNFMRLKVEMSQFQGGRPNLRQTLG